MRNTNTMGPGLHFPIYSRGAYRDCTSQLIPGYRTTRHLLRSSSLSLCAVNGGCIRHYRSLRTLVPPLHRIYNTRYLNKNPLRNNICRGKSYLLPPTLPRPSRYATTILRLPRCLLTMKYCIINWLSSLTSSSRNIPLYSMRSIYCQTGGPFC